MIYHNEENNDAGQICAVLESNKISFKKFSLNQTDSGSIKKFNSFFTPSGLLEKTQRYADSRGKINQINTGQLTGNLTHLLVLSSLSKNWLDFLAGFSYGSRIPVLIYGQDAITGISEEFASCFVFLKTADSLQRFFEAENLIFKKQEAAKKIIKAQETLLGMGVPVTAESFAQCAAEGRIQEISYFLDAGFSPNIRNKAGIPLLNIAARNGNREATRFLIKANASLDLQADDRGSTALIDAVMGKHCEIVLELIGAGADLDLKTKDGQTALIVAVGAGDEKIVEALLKAGADPDISDSLGVSAKKYASLFKKEALIALFEAYAAR